MQSLQTTPRDSASPGVGTSASFFRQRSKTRQKVGVGRRALRRRSSLQPCPGGHALWWRAPGPSRVMPVPRAHTPSLELRYRVPQAQLSLAHAGESRGEDMTLAREDSPHGPHPLMGCKPLLGEGGRKEGRHPAACPGELGGPRSSKQLADLGAGVGARERQRGLKEFSFPRASGWPLAWRTFALKTAGGACVALSRSVANKRPQRLIPTAGDICWLPGVAARPFPNGAPCSPLATMGQGAPG